MEPHPRTLGEGVLGTPEGQYAETSHGVTHYVFRDNKNGPLLIMIHGLGGSLTRFEKIGRALHAEGCRVLAYDLYDRGWSESSPTRYPLSWLGAHSLHFTMDVHMAQLDDLLKAIDLGHEKDLILIGHSTGGAVCISFATAFPERVAGIVPIDAVCLPPVKSLAASIATVPYLGDAVVSLVGKAATLNFLKESVHDPEADCSQEFFETTRKLLYGNPRYIAAMASTNRYCKGFTDSLLPEFEACCRAAIPMTLIWGERDKSTPFEHCLELKRIATEIAANELTLVSFPDIPHNVYFPDARPRECTAAIQALVKRALPDYAPSPT